MCDFDDSAPWWLEMLALVAILTGLLLGAVWQTKPECRDRPVNAEINRSHK